MSQKNVQKKQLIGNNLDKWTYKSFEVTKIRKDGIPPRMTVSLQNLLLSLRLNKENTDDFPLLRFPEEDAAGLAANS